MLLEREKIKVEDSKQMAVVIRFRVIVDTSLLALLIIGILDGHSHLLAHAIHLDAGDMVGSAGQFGELNC